RASLSHVRPDLKRSINNNNEQETKTKMPAKIPTKQYILRGLKFDFFFFNEIMLTKVLQFPTLVYLLVFLVVLGAVKKKY
ncbi:hypothetical protein ACQP3L_33520, partial [Escherichia coli]